MPTSPGTVVVKPVLVAVMIGDDATGMRSATAVFDDLVVFLPPAILSASALAVVFLEPDRDGLGIV